MLDRSLAARLFRWWKDLLAVLHLWKHQIWHDGFGHLPSFCTTHELNVGGASPSKRPTALGLDGAHFQHLMAVLVQSIPKTTAHELVADDVMGHSQVSQRPALLLLLLLVCF